MMDAAALPLYAMVAAVAALDALFLWWVCGRERALGAARARRAGYSAVAMKTKVPV